MDVIFADILLNFLLILTPLYFVQFIISNYHTIGARVFLGVLLGIAAVLCMLFPMVSGDGFLWDLRWVALLISVLYGGILSGGITATLIIVFRFSLGGFQGSMIVVGVAIVLIIVFLLLRRTFHLMTFRQRMFISGGLGIIAWGVAVLGIVTHFLLNDQLSALSQMATPIFSSMFVLYLLSSVTFIYFSESMRYYTLLKNEALTKEKVNYITEVGELLGTQLTARLETAAFQIEELRRTLRGVELERVEIVKEELDELSSSILKYTKEQEGSNQEEERPLVRVVEEVKGSMQPYAEQKGIHLKIDIELPESMEVNYLKMKQIVSNLVKNALDATPKSGHVSISAIAKRNWLYIYVEDNGIGIAQEQLTSLLDVNLNSPNSIAGEGLRMTQRLVRELGGTFSITSQVQKGTTVTLKFPI